MNVSADPIATVRAFIDAWNRRDRATIRAMFHPDISCTGASYPTANGVEEAMALSEPFLAAEVVDWDIIGIAQAGRTVFTERRDRFVFAGGQEVEVPAAGVFEINEDGKILRWQDYFDTACLAHLDGLQG